MAKGSLDPRGKSAILNALILIGVLLWFGRGAFPLMNVPKQECILVNLAFSISMLIQIVRGLLWHLHTRSLPAWFVLSRLDKGFFADSTIVVLVVLAILELAVRGALDVSLKHPFDGVFNGLAVAQLVLGSCLFVLCLKRTNKNLGIPLLGSLVFMLVFASPLLLAAGVAYSMYRLLDIQSERDMEALLISASVPLVVAVISSRLRDKRDRLKNTSGTISFQIYALPAIPLCYFSLRAFWPQQVSLLVFPFVLLALSVLIMLPFVFGRQRPWLVKEKVEGLQLEVKADQNASSRIIERESQMADIRRQLASNRLALKRAADHIDRADAYWKLGDLFGEFGKYDEAKESYNSAVGAYNDALALEPDNRIAIANKFNTVEALNTLERRRRQM